MQTSVTAHHTACERNLQQCSSTLLVLRELLSSVPVQGELHGAELTAELSTDCLDALAKLAHAQYVECLFIRTHRMGKGAGLLAKIAALLAELYSGATRAPRPPAPVPPSCTLQSFTCV